jgi:hypothetical protein
MLGSIRELVLQAVIAGYSFQYEFPDQTNKLTGNV